MPSAAADPRIVDIYGGKWQEHTRFSGVFYKVLLTSADNSHANINAVQVPPGGVIGSHSHPFEIETVYVISGNSSIRIGSNELSFNAGHIVSIPVGIDHSLRNTGLCAVELLTIFTPPIA